MSAERLAEMDPGAFLRLLHECGLDLREMDLIQLSRRKLMEPVGESESFYTELHLFVAAQYLEAIRPYRHVWAPRDAEPTLAEVERLGGQVNALVRGELNGERGRTLLVEVERFLAGIDPFGPLSDMVDFLQPALKARLRNDGRLYAELRRAAMIVAARLSEVDQDDPLTQPMFGIKTPGLTDVDDLRSTQVIEEEESLRSRAAREAIDSVLSAASSVFDEPDEKEDEIDTQVLSAAEMEFDGPVKKKDDELQEIQVAEVVLDPLVEEGLREESSEPIVLLTDEEDEDGDVSSPKEGGGEEEPLLLDDSFLVEEEEEEEKENENRGSQEEGASLDATGDMKVLPNVPEVPDERREMAEEKSVAARIEELNRLRQVYLKEQRWEELVELYEEGLELFRDPQELQTVYLVMATLYETKLERPARALMLFGKAFEVYGGEGRRKARAALARLGSEAWGPYHDIVKDLRVGASWDTDDRLWLRRQEVLATCGEQGGQAGRKALLEAVQSEGEVFFAGEGLEVVKFVGASQEGELGELINELVDAGMSGELFDDIQ